MIPIRTSPDVRVPSGLVPFALGFRPFFMLAGLGGMVLIALWLLLWHSRFPPGAYYGRLGWHGHEMLFGYAVAVVAGFLLTAVRNWTGMATPTGTPLAGLAAVWLAGRVLPWIPGVADWLVVTVDMAFIPLFGLALLRPLWGGANRWNRLFLLLLFAMTLANAMVHAEAVGLAPSGTAGRGIELMLVLVLLLLVWVAGRVMPFFTERAVAGARPRVRWWLEAAGASLMVALALACATGFSGPIVTAIAVGAGAVQMLRLAGWHDRRVWRIPILWVLYTGYAWLAAGLILYGLSAAGSVPRSPAIHALTAGAIGIMTLGMMARVALGHTGREVRSVATVNTAFVLLNLAAAVRVLGPWLAPAWYLYAILLAGLLWVLAFGLFCWVYLPILAQARVDGQPG